VRENPKISFELDCVVGRIKGGNKVGDVRMHSYRQIATAVGEGATAGMAAEHWVAEHGG
jgi:thioredoxin reductase